MARITEQSKENIIVEYHLDNLGTKIRDRYVAHAYCYSGCSATLSRTSAIMN